MPREGLPGSPAGEATQPLTMAPGERGATADHAAGPDRQPGRARPGQDRPSGPDGDQAGAHGPSQPAGSMSPASAQAGMITNGGTATEPNGVPSPAMRSGGRPGAPTGTHSSRRASSIHQRRDRKQQHRHARDDADPGRRWRTANRATGSIAANAVMAAIARRLIPTFRADHGGHARTRRAARAPRQVDRPPRQLVPAPRHGPRPRIAADRDEVKQQLVGAGPTGRGPSRGEPNTASRRRWPAPLREVRAAWQRASSAAMASARACSSFVRGSGTSPGAPRARRPAGSAPPRPSLGRRVELELHDEQLTQVGVAAGEPHPVEGEGADRLAAVEPDRSLGPRLADAQALRQRRAPASRLASRSGPRSRPDIPARSPSVAGPSTSGRR